MLIVSCDRRCLRWIIFVNVVWGGAWGWEDFGCPSIEVCIMGVVLVSFLGDVVWNYILGEFVIVIVCVVVAVCDSK